jgi:hypothetical protein
MCVEGLIKRSISAKGSALHRNKILCSTCQIIKYNVKWGKDVKKKDPYLLLKEVFVVTAFPKDNLAECILWPSTSTLRSLL